ncbi:MAG: hypothetical protein ACE5IY_22145, partial [bacterium]
FMLINLSALNGSAGYAFVLLFYCFGARRRPTTRTSLELEIWNLFGIWALGVCGFTALWMHRK